MPRPYRIGQIVPSSNITMETEIPAMLRTRLSVLPERFTFHSSRMRMKNVTKRELEAMDEQSLRCAVELADAQVDIMGYACLVAIMSMGMGYHRESETKLGDTAAAVGCQAPVVTSAGALVDTLKVMGARTTALITPYMRPLTDLVVGYIEAEGIRVLDSIALEIPNNLEVGERDPMALIGDLDRLDYADADVVVLSACVQMPSLAAIETAEARAGKPVISTATCTTYQMLRALHLDPIVPEAGSLLANGRAKTMAGSA